LKKFAIAGTVGVPGNYGGFETLADNLVVFAKDQSLDHALTVYCSSKSYQDRPPEYQGAKLRYIPLSANGAQAILYDMWSLVDAVFRRTDTVLLLGHGGSFIIPLLRPFTRTRFITNIDGIEWRREKWSRLASWVLRKSEACAIRFSHEIITDNQAISEYVMSEFGKTSHVIPYGGDHALTTEPEADPALNLPDNYALSLCRIEPENNVAMILEAFAQMPERDLVFVGNWDKSDYGRDLKAKYSGHENLHLLDPVYHPGHLRWVRDGAHAYVHGHSAGGTNPSLVEMMHFGIPVFAHGCNFNRYTTEDRAIYFESAESLMDEVKDADEARLTENGTVMREIAQRRYTWDHVGRTYFDLMVGA